MLNKFVSLFILINQKTKQPSYILTMVVFGFFIINIKLLFSGITLPHDIKMSEFSGVDYAAAVGALGGIHIFNNKNPPNDKQE